MASTVKEVLTLLSTPPKGARPGSGPGTIIGTALACGAVFALLQATGVALPKAPGRRLAKAGDALEWNLRVVSTLHAVLLTVGSIICFAESFSYTPTQAYIGYAWAPDVFARIFLGYLLYDAAAMVGYYSTLQDPAGLFHHLLFIPAAAYVLAHSIMAFPFVWLSWCEVSTPFVNYRWHLAATGRKNERVYALNALAVGALFFIARVVCYGAGLADLLSPAHRKLWGGPRQPFGHKAVVTLFAVGWGLNLYWFNLIVKAAKRAMRGAPVSASTRSHDAAGREKRLE